MSDWHKEQIKKFDWKKIPEHHVQYYWTQKMITQEQLEYLKNLYKDEST